MRKSGMRRIPGLTSCLWLLVLLSISVLFCMPAVASEENGGHGDPAAKGWVATDTYRVINFGILAAALFFILRKPASQALNSRISGIKEQLEELEMKKQEAEKELAQHKEKLALLDKEAEKFVEEYIRQGNEAKARILKEAELMAEKLETKAKRNIEHEFKQARNQLQTEIIEQALAKAEKEIIEKISSEDQTRLVDEYLEKVVA
jgi:F-type H+-transporting ATPase subunit b